MTATIPKVMHAVTPSGWARPKPWRPPASAGGATSSLNDRLRQALRRSQLPDAPASDAKLAMLFIDMDGFKPISARCASMACTRGG